MATLLHFQQPHTAPKQLLWEDAVPFANIPEYHYEWLVDGLIAKGESLMLTGDFGSFKSYITYFLADAISRGEPFINRSVSQHPVLFLDRENSRATVSIRRYLVGNLQTADNVRIFGRFTNPVAQELESLTHICETMKPVVIVDSMQDFHAGLKENDADDMAVFMSKVNNLIDAGAVSVILIHHVNRSGKYRGSSGIPGGVGGAISIEKVGATGVRLQGYKTRDGENGDIELKLKFSPGNATYEVVRSGLDKIGELKARIIEHIRSNDGCSTNELAKSLGGDRNEIYGLVDCLVGDKHLTKDDTKKSGLHIAKACAANANAAEDAAEASV